VDVLDQLTHAAVKVTPSNVGGLWTVTLFTPAGRRVISLDRESRGDCEVLASAVRAALAENIRAAILLALGQLSGAG
jgi:hypothetical protein